jgi:integrase
VPELGVPDLEAILVAARDLGGTYGSLDSTLIEAAATSRRLRMGELLALQWGDIDWIEGTINVERVLREGTPVGPKCGGPRRVRLAPHTHLTLLRYRASLPTHGPGDLVFSDPKNGDFLDARSLRRRLGAACRLAGFRAIAVPNLPLAFKAPWWSRYL